MTIHEKQEQTVMSVSLYSNISQKLNFLAQSIKDEKDGEIQNVYIECFTDKRIIKGEEKDVKIIRFSTDLKMWTEINPCDKFKGDLLPKSVAVNLYDLYNIIDNCRDDIISFWIDESDVNNPQLVIDSFYNELRQYDELEARMKINLIDFPIKELGSEEGEAPLYTVTLDNISIYSIVHQLNFHKTTGINIVVKNRKIRFQSDYNGFKTDLVIKAYKDQIFFKDFSVFIPFHVFNLMCATGQINDLKFDIYEDHVEVETDDYGFSYQIEKKVEPFEITDETTNDFLVVDPELVFYPIQILNRVNKPAEISVAKIDKFDERTGNITVSYKDRYSVSSLIEMAILSDEKVEIDSNLLEFIFTKTGVDAVKVKCFENKDVYIGYENALFEKKMIYNHEEFIVGDQK